jgi:hypothetical protein
VSNAQKNLKNLHDLAPLPALVKKSPTFMLEFVDWFVTELPVCLAVVKLVSLPE